MLTDQDILSRESLAGYDLARIRSARVALVGCGAAGNNIAQTLALVGVGEVRAIDPDTVDPSNLTRSPLFRRERLGKHARYKARELAQGVLQLSFAEDPVVRLVTTPVQALGLGALAGVSVIVGAVDSLVVRAWLSDAAQLLGVPFVELGFRGFEGHVSVFSNRSSDDACWRCAHPHVSSVRRGCELYARAVAAEGLIPATQSVAAILGNLAAEAAIQAIHGNFPLDGRQLRLDAHTGRTTSIEIMPEPRCPGVHRTLAPPRVLDVRANEPLAKVFAALDGHLEDPLVHLTEPVVVEAPCERCGAVVRVQKPVWAITSTPACGRCAERPPTDESRESAAPYVVRTIDRTSPLASIACRRLGLPAGAMFEVEDRATRALHVVQLAGTPDDLFTTLRRTERNAEAPARMTETDAARDAAEE